MVDFVIGATIIRRRIAPGILKKLIRIDQLFVRRKRFELSQPFGRYHLKVVRLPVSPPPQGLQI
jgi:hypothetical protein